MEVWFIAALGAALGSGLSAFIFKVAAKRNYHSEALTLHGGIASVILFVPVAFVLSPPGSFQSGIAYFAIGTGLVAAVVGILKVYALRYIDTTIYFPLFKLFGPLLAIVIGIIWFEENFSPMEWVGLVAGMLVPLMLITKSENNRQNNLFMGVVLVLITGTLAALVSALNKQMTDLYGAIYWILAFSSVGIVVGSLLSIYVKNKSFRVLADIKEHTTKDLVLWAFARSIVISLGMLSILYAFLNGGTLGIVYTVQSFYILIPIILAIVFYNEHWNLQKVIAIVLSVASLALLG